MDEPFSGLLFHEDDRPQWEALTCVWCDAVLGASALPDERTTGLWLNRCCRECGDRYGLTANLPDADAIVNTVNEEAANLLEASVTRR